MPPLNKIWKCQRHYSRQHMVLKNVAHTFDAWDNGSLLNGRWLLKTIGINSSQELLTEVHVIEIVNDLLPVALPEREHQA